MNEKIDLNNEELKEEEVNIYGVDCGETMYHCLHDCVPFANAMLNSNL